MNSPFRFREDLKSAIEHADVEGYGWQLSDFRLEFLGKLTVDQLREYDDIDSWLDTNAEDYDSLRSNKDKIAELASFRGEAWAKQAEKWLETGIPPIVVITAPAGYGDGIQTQIGDGRGRVNFANAFGLAIPTHHLIFKGLNLENIIKEELKYIK